MTVPSVNLPSLSSMKVESVLLFLQEWKIYSSVTPKKELVPARLLVDSFSVRVPISPEIRHIFNLSYRSPRTKIFSLAMSELKLDVRIGDVRERLQRSLLASIRNDVFPDLHSLVETTTDELLDCSRVASWTRGFKTSVNDVERTAGTKTRSSWRSQDLKKSIVLQVPQAWTHLPRLSI
ncbi:hypothetical protein P9112_010204 [Eukaryota sp. TZLM1-RC]